VGGVVELDAEELDVWRQLVARAVIEARERN